MRERSATAPGEGIQTKLPVWLLLAMVVAAAGGGWVAAAIASFPGVDLSDSLVLLLLFLAAPFYEEALKPIGVYFIYARWPHVTLGRWHTAALAAVGGLTFGLVESWLFVDSHPEEGSDFVLFRFTAPLAMHVLASGIFGLGLSRSVVDWARRRDVLPRRARDAYLTAVGLHFFYNVTVVVLAIVGIREFVEQTNAR